MTEEQLRESDIEVGTALIKAIRDNPNMSPEEKLTLPFVAMLEVIKSSQNIRVVGDYTKEEHLHLWEKAIDQIVSGSNRRVLMLAVEIIEMSLPGFAKNPASRACVDMLWDSTSAICVLRHKLISLVEKAIAQIKKGKVGLEE